MKNNIIKFFKGFTYAFKGIIYNIKSERNFRFHITAMVWVILLSLFYDLSRVEYAVLLLTFSSVIALEAVNTAVERAVDISAEKKNNDLAGKAKDSAAAAVLISAVFSVGVAVCLFFDTKVFSEIGNYFGNDPVMLAPVAALAVISFIFVFKGK
jgi:diacylglycerol kinase